MKDKPPAQALVASFDQYLAYYEANPPFARAEQLANHRRTIDLRRRLGSAAAALADDNFLGSLSQTLLAWGVGSHNSVLVEPPDFRHQLRSHATEIMALDGVLIEQADATTGDRVWRIIRSLDIVLGRRTLKPTQSKLVGGSKALHHLLPELVVPIDRMYTAPFLLRIQPQHFQNPSKEAETFRIAFDGFQAIAKKVNPAQYIGRSPWNTSRTKVIDNAIVGFIRGLRDEIRNREASHNLVK